MANTVKVKRSGTASATPSALEHGELAINYADAKLFWKDATNTIRSFVFQAYASATHKSTHATGGSDALTPSDIGAAALSGATFTGAVEFDRTVANSSATALVVDGNFSTTSNAEIVALGVFSDVRKTVSSGVTDSGKLFGGQFDAVADGDGTLAEAYGVYARAVNLGEGNLTTATAIYAHVIGGTTGYGVYIAAGSATNSWGVYQAGTEKNYFAGNVGIGRASPASALDVNGVITVAAGSASAAAVCFSGDANTGIAQIGGADSWSVVAAGTERVRVDSSGRVGIGHNTPSDFNQVMSGQHVVVGSGANSPGVTVYSGTGGSGAIAFADGTTTTDQYMGLISYNHSLDAMRFYTSAVERLRIKPGGAVRFVPLAADPAGGETGDVYYNSANNKLRVYNGTSWVDLH